MPKCPYCGNDYKLGEELCVYCGGELPPDTGVLGPSTVLHGRYEIERFVTAGGMGSVYFARDKNVFGKKCVVKQIKERVTSDAVLRRLQEEAQRMAELAHPNVAEIHDHFVEDGRYYLVVEYVPGRTLDEIFSERSGALQEQEVVNWAIQACGVLEHLHKKNHVHRDVSPDNLMATEEGTIMFIDFGTTRELQRIAQGTAGAGKYGYTPPEQWQGRPVPQSDIFALGATMYHLLTGFLPLSKECLSGQGPLKRDFSPDFPPIRTMNHSVSEELEVILDKALELDVSKRYQSAEDMKADLVALGKEEVRGIPILEVDVQHMDFEKLKVGTKQSQSFTLSNVGGGGLKGTLTSNVPWIKVPQVIDPGKHKQSVTVTVDTSGLNYGFMGTGVIELRTNGGTSWVTVKLTTEGYGDALKKFRVALALAGAFGAGSLGGLFGMMGTLGAMFTFVLFLVALVWSAWWFHKRNPGSEAGCGTVVAVLVSVFILVLLVDYAPVAGGVIGGITACVLFSLVLSERLFMYQCSNQATPSANPIVVLDFKRKMVPSVAIVSGIIMLVAIIVAIAS